MILVFYVLFPWSDTQFIQNIFLRNLFSQLPNSESSLSFITTIAKSFQPVYKNLKEYCLARLKILQLLLCLPISKSAIIQTATLNILKTFILCLDLIN